MLIPAGEALAGHRRRKAGEILAGMAGKGGHGGNRKSSSIVSLEKMGITGKQSSRWQLASNQQCVADLSPKSINEALRMIAGGGRGGGASGR
jgi:hypothetical protein